MTMVFLKDFEKWKSQAHRLEHTIELDIKLDITHKSNRSTYSSRNGVGVQR